MTFKSFITLLVLANYLLLAVMGCISRPEDEAYMFMIRTNISQNQHYEESRYLRMGGLEEFMAEALATRYKEAPGTYDHLVLSIIAGIDAHFLPVHFQIPATPHSYQEKTTSYHLYSARPVKDVVLAIYSPPDIIRFV